jgi:outer membrane protein assembly factor BamD (BamD/ComL family)
MKAQDNRQRAWLTISIVIAGLAAITASQPCTAQPATPPAATPTPGSNAQQHLSKPLLGPLRAAQDAMKAENYPKAVGKLEAANSIKLKSPYDQHVINELLGNAYAHTKNYGAAALVDEAVLSDGFVSPSEVERLMVAVAMFSYQIKNYDKAIEFGGRAIRSGSTNPQLTTMMSQAFYLKGDWDGAQRFVANVVTRQIAAGTVPDKPSLELWRSACIKLRDTSCERQAVEKLSTYYPSAH